MNQDILDKIPFRANFKEAAKTLRMRPDQSGADELKQLIEQAEYIANPKALYKIELIESKDDLGVYINGTYFQSRVLRVNLENAQRVFLYTATCGIELYEWMMSIDDPLKKFYAETINNMALRVAVETLREQITQRYQAENIATMNPGSLDDWPIQAQIPLFKLLGNTQEAIGVELLDSLLMLPNQSVSGILFETETHFASCQLCPMKNCPNRREPYDEKLYQRKYALEQ